MTCLDWGILVGTILCDGVCSPHCVDAVPGGIDVTDIIYICAS